MHDMYKLLHIIGLYKIVFYFEALLHKNIFFANTPFVVCNILHDITAYCIPPPPSFEVFLRCFEVFVLFLGVGFRMGRGF